MATPNLSAPPGPANLAMVGRTCSATVPGGTVERTTTAR